MRVLELDIETAPHRAYVWGLFQQNVAITQIEEPGYTLCFAARWQGERKIHFASVMQKGGAKAMVKRAHELLEEADAVCHFNGTKFDIPTLNREFLLHGLVPPSHYYEIDLYRTVRRRFKFASNKLDYVAQQLGLGAKVAHKGMALWRECMAGDAKAWAKMERYNKQDVRLLGALYERLQPWIPNHPNRGLWVDAADPTCRNCGSQNVVKNGVRRTTTMSYQRYLCRSCGAGLRARTRLAPAAPGVLV